MRRKKKTDVKAIVRTAIVWIIVLAVVAGIAVAAPIAVSRYRFSEAETAVAEGRIQRAIEMLEPELERTPTDTALRLRLADLYIEAGNYSRAEYVLMRGAAEKAGQSELYLRLVDVFIKQDKLYDAVKLINEMVNPNIKTALTENRPPAPVFDPPPGNFREGLTVSVSVREGDLCYITYNGEIPSVENLYAGPVDLPQGITDIRAVSISPDGLISDWTLGSYRLDDVIVPVIFEDAVIEKLAREMLEIPTGVIVSDKLQTITELVVPEAATYTSLGDLRHFTYLEKLSLTGAGGSVDISALGFLSRLKSLELVNMGIDSFALESVSRTVSLEHLNLSENNIVLLDNLSKLINLNTLILDSNNILDLTPLSGLVSLEHLSIRQNAVESTSPLQGMSRLSSLDLSGNLVSSLAGVAQLSSLTSLDISSNSVAGEELRHPARLKALKTLDVSYNRLLENISPLGQMSGLESLTANNCAISDLTGLGGMSGLTFLSLNENMIESLEGLQELSSLRVLWADKNSIASLRPIAELVNLAELHVEYNKLPSLVAIKNTETIKKIYAFGNPITERVDFKEGIEAYTGG